MTSPTQSLWPAYVGHFMGNLDQTSVADAIGVSQATISRWRSGKVQPTNAANVAAFAVYFRRSPIEAFVAAGLLSADDARALTEDEAELLRVLRTAQRFTSRGNQSDPYENIPQAAADFDGEDFTTQYEEPDNS